MFVNKAKLVMFVGILSLICTPAGFAAAKTAAKSDYTTIAVTFINAMAKGDFATAEADFTDQMKQVSPNQLKGIWDGVVLQAGAFQKIGATKTVHADGYDSVIVNTEFKNRTIGFKVTFDSTGKIGGLHFAPAS